MPKSVSLVLALVLLSPLPAAAAPADAGPAASSTEIAWERSLADAFARGKKDGIPVFVAINSQKVDGGRVEPAALELRTVTYLDPKVVAKSQKFACALLRSDGSSADFGELRARYSIDGQIVSPQHLFAYPDGSLMDRYEYWPWGTGQGAVDKLLELMDKALGKAAARNALGGLLPPGGSPGASPPAPGAPSASDDGAAPGADAAEAQRQEWLRKALEIVRTTKDPAARDAAVGDLIKNDRKGDCIEPLCGVLLELAKEPQAQVAILKALGRPGLEIVVPTVVQLLDAHDEDVRSNAAVTLEYVGSERAVEALLKRVGRDRDEKTANNVCRALGRCAAKSKDSTPARKALLKELGSAKNARALAGPAIGIAYLEKDADAARAVEGRVKRESDMQRKDLVIWALSEIRDPKSAEFLRAEVLAPEKNLLVSRWIRACVEKIEGKDDPTLQGTIDRGMGIVLYKILTEDGGLGGTARGGREAAAGGWTPKGEFQPQRWPGRGGGPGGNGGMGG